MERMNYHTIFPYDLSVEQMVDWADAMGIEIGKIAEWRKYEEVQRLSYNRNKVVDCTLGSIC